MTVNSPLARFIHSHGPLADLAYRTWHRVYDAKEKFRRPSCNQQKREGVYPVLTLSVAITEHCNSRCVFCIHPRLENEKIAMPNALFDEIMDAWSTFCKTDQAGNASQKLINLTPSGPPGEPLIDPGFKDKVCAMVKRGFNAFFVTNAIALNKHAYFVCAGGVGAVGISLPSFDADNYRETYRVDRCEQVTRNIFEFLDINRAGGWPVDTTINFRNSLPPSQIIAHPKYKRLREYFGPKCRAMFTTWWDDWNGGVPREEMERGWIRVRKPLNLNRVCEGAMSFSMRPTDRKIRLCGCRIVPGQDDLIVGDIDRGFADAQHNAVVIQDGFKRGVRPKTCQNCGAYKQA